MWLLNITMSRDKVVGKKKACQLLDRLFLLLVGVAGFELATPCTPCKCATRLRYTP